MQYKHKSALKRDLEERLIKKGTILEVLGEEELKISGKIEKIAFSVVGYFSSFDGRSIFLEPAKGYSQSRGLIVPLDKIKQYRIIF